MPTIYRVILLIERARAYGRGLLRGIARYTSIHGPWLPRMEPEFYRLSQRQSTQWARQLESADGVIAHLADRRIIETIVRSGVPAVIAGIREPAVRAHAVVTNDEAIGQMAVDYLLDRGLRRLAYCGLDDLYWSRQRGQTFLRQARQAGCEVRLYEPLPKPRGYTEDAERPLLAAWLRALPKPAGLLACNDDRAKQILAACQIAGLQVPDEIAILGIDNDELVCELQHPQLSSLALSVEAAGYRAATLLGELMAGRGSGSPSPRTAMGGSSPTRHSASGDPRQPGRAKETIVVSPLYVVERQSTDVLGTEDRDVAAGLRFIRGHARQGLQVQDVAEAMVLSRRAAQQRFRRVLGRSVHDEIKRTRIDEMARLLVTTNLSIKEIARLLQCTGMKNVARYFRQRTGLTPAQYRLRHGAK